MDRKPQPSHEDLEPKPVIPSEHDAEEMDDSELDLEEDDLDLDDDVTDEEAKRADGA
jgi:hypothetical protein